MPHQRCFLPNCRRRLKEYGTHKIPKNELYRKLWIDSIEATFPKIGDLKLKENIYICSMHFKGSETFLSTRNQKKIRKYAVPKYFFTSPDLPDDQHYRALKCGFKFTTEKDIHSRIIEATDFHQEGLAGEEGPSETKIGKLSNNGVVLHDQEDPKCPFLNTDNVALKFQWMKDKKLAGFEGDEEFLQFLLDEAGYIYKDIPKGVGKAVSIDHPYSMKTEASSKQNGCLLLPKIAITKKIPDEGVLRDLVVPLNRKFANHFQNDYVYPGAPREKIVRTSSGRRIKAKKYPDEVLHFRLSDDEDEPELPKKPRIHSMKAERNQSTKLKRRATTDDEDYAPTAFDAAFNSDEEDPKEKAQKKSKDKRGNTPVPICPMCNFKMAAATKLDDKHAKTHLNDMFGNKKKCVICSETVENPLGHFWTHVFKAVACMECEVVIPNAGLFNYHECKEEKGGCSLQIRKSVEVPPDLVSIFRFYGPMVENQNHAETSEVEKHQKILVYKCLLCEKRFKGIGKINRHMIREHKDRVKPRYDCTTCGRMFWYSVHLDLHEITVHNAREKMCGSCGKTVPGKLYGAHMRGHKTKHPCGICGKLMLDSYKLKLHMMIHTNTKSYACEFCDKTFVQKINRDQHQRLHTGEARYHCKFCDKKFIQSSNYVQHLRQHTKVRARGKKVG